VPWNTASRGPCSDCCLMWGGPRASAARQGALRRGCQTCSRQPLACEVPSMAPNCRFSRVHMCIARPGACPPRRLGPVCVCGCIQQGPVPTNRITACMRIPALRRLGSRPMCTSSAPCDCGLRHLVWLRQPPASQALQGKRDAGSGWRAPIKPGRRVCAGAGRCRRYLGVPAPARLNIDIGLATCGDPVRAARSAAVVGW
jgi:hypothetical protein